MTKQAKILKINNNKALIGLLNSKNECKAANCEGCSCTTKIPTMFIDIENNTEIKEGELVQINSGYRGLLDFILLILTPLLVTLFLYFILPSPFKAIPFIGGGASFLLSALLLKLIPQKELIITKLKA